MKQELKIVLIIVAVVAAYHYFFRSMKPSTMANSKPVPPADTIQAVLDEEENFGAAVVEPYIGIFGNGSPATLPDPTIIAGEDNRGEYRSTGSVTILSGR